MLPLTGIGAKQPITTNISGRLPDLVENACSNLGLVLRQETTVMLADHLRRILNGVTCLLVGAGLFQDVGCQHVTHIVRPVREKSFDRAAPGPGIEDAVALDDEPPGLVECVLVIGGIGAGPLRGLDEEGFRIVGRPNQPGAVSVDVRLEFFIEAPEVREDQAERLGAEEGRACVFECDGACHGAGCFRRLASTNIRRARSK